MKRLTMIFFVALVTALAALVVSAEAREYKGPERGKMGWGSGGAAAYEMKGGAAGGLRDQAAEPHKYIAPERGKMGWGAQVVKTR